MKRACFKGFGLAVVAVLMCGCFGVVEDEGAPRDDARTSGGVPDNGSVDGVSCRFLTGEATLADYDGQNQPAASFSFEFGTQDPEITRQKYDVLFEMNTFRVNLVVGDASHIVDLGAVALAEVPATVDPDDYPLGQFGEHDFIDAVIGHTYFVRSADGTGRRVAAFQVVGLEPGLRVTIRWIASTDPDLMLVPTECGV